MAAYHHKSPIVQFLNNNKLVIGAVGLLLYFTKTYLSSRAQSPSSTNDASLLPLQGKIMVVALEVKLQSESDTAQYIDAWKTLRSFVGVTEPGVLTYSLGKSDKEDNLLLLYDRYQDLDYFVNTHKKTEHLKQFKNIIAPLNAVFRKNAYSQSSLGFVSRSQQVEEKAANPFMLFVEVTFKTETDVAEFEKHFRVLAEYVEKEEPTTLSFYVAHHAQNPLKVLLVERYMDKDNAFLKIHRSSATFLDFRPKLAKLAPEMRGNSWAETSHGFSRRP